jgi:hypothetical protein
LRLRKDSSCFKEKEVKYPAAELRGIKFSKKLSSPLRDCVVIVVIRVRGKI